MRLHEQKFPNIWKYLAKLGRDAKLSVKHLIYLADAVYSRHQPKIVRVRILLSIKKINLNLIKEEQLIISGLSQRRTEEAYTR